ncbi:hypothetical protein A6770_06025 [Nostoc minutum NIES-26]|uniref:Uncharacterized protein n=1 Tax=Nostoc minutum NIES-26 TaxID=1844469 RepID=A0A367Q8P9_9NOSO|nr:hypothetical protein A6770_06025 [Nostoc minutum NIES-26]
METPSSARIQKETERRFAANTAMGRNGQVEDIASVVALLASDECGWVQGSTSKPVADSGWFHLQAPLETLIVHE